MDQTISLRVFYFQYSADLILFRGGKQMELVAVRTIDELGQIIIPKEERQAKGWHKGTEIAIYTHSNALVLEAHKPEEEQEA